MSHTIHMSDTCRMGQAKNSNLAKCDVSKQLRQFHSKLFERLSLITEDQLNKRNEKKYNNMVDNISQIITKEDFQLVIENEELKPKGKTHSFANSQNKVWCIFPMVVISIQYRLYSPMQKSEEKTHLTLPFKHFMWPCRYQTWSIKNSECI